MPWLPLSFLLSPAYYSLDDIIGNLLMDPKRLQGRGLRRRVNDLIPSVKFTLSARTSGCIRKCQPPVRVQAFNCSAPPRGRRATGANQDTPSSRELQVAPRVVLHLRRTPRFATAPCLGRRPRSGRKPGVFHFCRVHSPSTLPRPARRRLLPAPTAAKRAPCNQVNDGFRPVLISHHPAPADAARISGSCRWRWSVAVRIRPTSVPCSAQADRGRRR